MGRGRRVFTPEKTLEFQRELAAQYDGPLFEGPIEMTVTYHKDRTSVTIMDMNSWPNDSRLTGDVDNYLKATLDALNGVAYVDDKQVKMISGEKR
jgi:Holliday junction resolvase RusA-like endonuclease